MTDRKRVANLTGTSMTYSIHLRGTHPSRGVVCILGVLELLVVGVVLRSAGLGGVTT